MRIVELSRVTDRPEGIPASSVFGDHRGQLADVGASVTKPARSG
jgi:hypothetical protein